MIPLRCIDLGDRPRLGRAAEAVRNLLTVANQLFFLAMPNSLIKTLTPETREISYIQALKGFPIDVK